METSCLSGSGTKCKGGNLQHYEAAFLLKPDLSEKDVERFVSEVKQLLSEHGAKDLEPEKVERRTLAYPVKKHTEGYYVFIGFFAPPQLPAQIRTEMRHRDELLRLAFIRKPVIIPEPEPFTSEPVSEETDSLNLDESEPETDLSEEDLEETDV